MESSEPHSAIKVFSMLGAPAHPAAGALNRQYPAAVEGLERRSSTGEALGLHGALAAGLWRCHGGSWRWTGVYLVVYYRRVQQSRKSHVGALTQTE